jgi:hypothetical protein
MIRFDAGRRERVGPRKLANILLAVTSKPASWGRNKTGHSEVIDSGQISGTSNPRSVMAVFG